MIEHPVACPVCGAAWDYATTWIGELRAIHPVTRCVPKPAPRYEVEDEADYRVPLRPRKCEECHQVFIPHSRATRSQVVCGSECRKARRERVAEYKRGLWKISAIARMNFPIKTCVQCGEMFIPNTKFSAKQIICGAECVALRVAEQAKAKYKTRKVA